MNEKLGNFQSPTFEVVPVLDTNQFASGDVMCATAQLALSGSAPATNRLRIEIVGLVVHDADDQGGLLDVVFLKSNVQLGTPNSAISISAADAANVVGIVPVTSWYDLVNSQRAQPSFDPIVAQLDSQYLYVALVSRDTKTYTAAGLKLSVSVRLQNLPLA